MEVIKLNIDRITETEIKIHFNNERKLNMFELVRKVANQEIIIQEATPKIEKDSFRVTKQGGKGFVIIMITDTKEDVRYKFRY